MSGVTGAAIAIGASAVVGAGATIYAANKSAAATKAASDAAIKGQQGALAQQAALTQPYRDLGTANIPTYQNLLTGTGSGAAPGSPQAAQKIQQTLESMPGYQATLNTGIEAAKRSSAASGLNLSGNQVAGVEQFGSQLADQTYQQQLNNLLQPIQLGQAAASNQAANVGTSASNIGNLQVAQGNTNAAISANEVAGLTRAASGATNQYLTYNTLQGLNNPAGVAPSYSAINDPNYFSAGEAAASAPTYAADAGVLGR